MICTVYALTSTRDHAVRYIGQTTQSLAKRLDSHIHCPAIARQRYVARWIKREREDGFSIEIVPILTGAAWNQSEKLLIASYRASGARLVNLTDGGEGILGRKHTEEVRLRMSAIAKARQKTPEHLAKIAAYNASRIGKKLTEEHRAKVSAALSGKRPKNLEALWEKSRGKPWSEEQRRATMAAHQERKKRKAECLGL